MRPINRQTNAPRTRAAAKPTKRPPTAAELRAAKRTLDTIEKRLDAVEDPHRVATELARGLDDVEQRARAARSLARRVRDEASVAHYDAIIRAARDARFDLAGVMERRQPHRMSSIFNPITA